MYSDQAPELKNAVTTLGALHQLSTPGMPKTNGVTENKVKLVLHGAVKPDLNLDGGHLPLGISPWQETLRIEATDHPGRDAMVTETSAESFCRLAV